MKTVRTLSVVIICLGFVACGNKTAETNYTDKFEGKVKREVISIAPKISGRIIALLVNEGDTVKAGDTLAMIDIPDIEAKVEQTEGAMLSATAQYEMSLNGATIYERQQIKEKYNAAKEQFDLAEKSFKRIKSMADDSLISQQKYDEVYELYQAAAAQLKAVESQKKDIDNGVRKEKIQMAEGDMKKAEGAHDEASSALLERYVVAPSDMVIETISLHKGELALAGYTFFTGYTVNDVYFRFTIGEKRLVQYTKGSVYKVCIPYLKNKLVDAKLVSVKDMGGYAKKTASYPDYELGESTYELKLVPINKEETRNLYTNMTILLNKENEK
jgi:HlyD family secretion protein